MESTEYDIIRVLREKAALIAQSVSEPRFYREKPEEMEQSMFVDSNSSIVEFAKKAVINRGDKIGHGYRHARKVAIESGAIVYSEKGFSPDSNRLAEIAIIAGYLHDIKRDEKDHPAKGARAAEELLSGKMDDHELLMVTFAIRNHEAFKQHETIENCDIMLLADSLYDADKFRWGPDNFIYTLWDMAESMNLTLDFIMKNYEKGVEGIKKIKTTFRTSTGRQYGPDFIDRGLEIGGELYSYCMKLFEK